MCLLFLSPPAASPHIASVNLALDLPVDVAEELHVAHGGLRTVVHELREEVLRLERILGDEHAHLVRVRVTGLRLGYGFGFGFGLGLGLRLGFGYRARVRVRVRVGVGVRGEHAHRLQQVWPLGAHRVDQLVDAARQRVVHRGEAKPRAVDALRRAHLQHVRVRARAIGLGLGLRFGSSALGSGPRSSAPAAPLASTPA